MLREVLPILIMTTSGRREGKGGEKKRQLIGRPWQLDFNSRTVSCRGPNLPLYVSDIYLFVISSMIKSLLGLESNQYPGSMTASLQVGQNHQQGSSWSDMNCREDESSSSEEESSSDSEESYLQEKQTSGGRIKDNFVKSSSSGTVKEEVDTLEEEYFRFLEVTEKHRQNRDEGQSLKKKFDIRTDTITDEILEEGLAMIGTDHEKTKREMDQLYGSKAMKVHSEETKVGR